MITALRQLLVLEAQDMLSAERQLIDALPSMIAASRSEELRDQLDSHLGETRRQLDRTEQAMHALGAEPSDDQCEAMEGLISETEELIDEELSPAILDAALVLAAQKIEYYEIASYRGLIALSRSCGEDEALELFEQNLAEEERAADRLDRLASGTIHKFARDTEEVDVEGDVA